ncbi:MAG: hypothetical protein H0X40_01875 [Chthoniobacterales bacterium]|nr:hypothetical protein [Chthoniobacterales bacterium]
MRTKSSSTWLTLLLVVLAAGMFVTVTGWLLASPADDISQAVTSGGKKDVKAADADSFVNAFSSVYVGVEDEKADAYIDAAKKLRPDLAERITSAAAEVDNAPADPNTGVDRRVSRHRHRVQICCSMHTLYLPAKKARYFLATHHTCHRGACHSHHYHHHHHGHWDDDDDESDT